MNEFDTGFTLQLFHLSDQEANTTSVALAPNLSAILNALSAEDIDGDGTAGYADTLVLSSGDAWIPGLFYDASEAIWGVPGAADILIQNELGVQAIGFGNHEFDKGTGVIAELLSGDIAFDDDETPEDFLPYAGADFPYLAGNLDYSTDPNLAPLATPDGQGAANIGSQVSGSALVTTEGGESIGLVAAVVPTIEDGLSSPGSDLTVLPESNSLEDLAALIQADVDALVAANPDLDKIILLSHQQVLSREVELAGLLEGVDIIMAGGSNSVLLDETDAGFDGEAADGVYPIFETAGDGAPVAVINTDAAYNYLGRLVIDFDENGEIIPDSYDPDLSGAFETSDAGVARLGAEGLVDPEIQEIADLVQAQIAEGESNFFAVTDVFLNAERAGGGTDGVRTQETNLGNLTADANLWYAEQLTGEDIDVSFKNGGGIRANIGRITQPAGDADPERLPPEGVPGVKPEGGISENDVANALAFNNGLTLLSLTTEQLVETVEATLENYTSLEESAGGWGQFAGVQFSFDPARDPGARIVNAAVVDDETGEVTAELVRDGEIVDNGDQTFRTVTLNFLANGGAGGLPVTEPGDDGFDQAIADAAERFELYQDADGDLSVDDDAPATGDATFAADGTEQDALAEYLLSEFGMDGATTFSEADTPPELDERIQNLDFRADTVFPDVGPEPSAITEIRVASYNASLERSAAGELQAELEAGDSAQAASVAEVIQSANPDILLINEIDPTEGVVDAFRDLYLEVPQGDQAAVEHPFVYIADSNTGIDSGQDLNGDGETGTPNDAFGFGTYEEEFGFVIFSKFEIDTENVRTFQEFLWADMPGNLLTDANTEGTEPLTDLLDQDAVDVFRLSSKNHVDVPVIVNGETVHVLAAHPTPPVFDDPTFDLNGKRNNDEIRFWADYVEGEDYFTDDDGTTGGLAEGERFVIVGDYNADPFDGDSVPGAAQQIIESPAVIGSTTDASITPTGLGSLDQPGGVNAEHEGDPRFDTADFGFNSDNPAEDVTPGNLRVDYALPSEQGFQYVDGAVVWPAADDPFSAVTSFPTSDHRLVYADLRIVEEEATVAFGPEQEVAAEAVTLDAGIRDVSLTGTPAGGFAFTRDGDAGATTVYGADAIAFTDGNMFPREDRLAADIARIYEVAMDRLYDVRGLDFWYDFAATGVVTLGQLGSIFADSMEFRSVNGIELGTEDFVDAILGNADEATFEDGFRDMLVSGLQSGDLTRGQALVDVATSDAAEATFEPVTDDGVLLLA